MTMNRFLALALSFAADLTASEAAALAKSEEVRYVSKVIDVHLLDDQPPPAASVDADTPPRYSSQQFVPVGIDTVHARDVWPYAKGAGPINVVMLDTGIDYRHPDLKTNYVAGYDTFTKTGDPFDDNKHGTHVAGTIAATDNGFGVVGVAPETKLWAVKVLNRNGQGTTE